VNPFSLTGHWCVSWRDGPLRDTDPHVRVGILAGAALLQQRAFGQVSAATVGTGRLELKHGLDCMCSSSVST
jgi:hypothetical protein